MAHFMRTRPVPVVGRGYGAYRPFVRSDFAMQCAYCLMLEVLAGGQENFELDHFKPYSVFPLERDDFYNLYYACHPCNHIKRAKWPSSALISQGYGFVDFCAADFSDHYDQLADGYWQPRTSQAAYTEKALKLNREHLKEIRRLIARLRALGEPI